MRLGTPKINMVISMLIFSTIGFVVKEIDLPSPVIVMFKTVIGSMFLTLVLVGSKNKFSFSRFWQNKLMLLVAGLVLGGGWILLFMAYKYTTVSAATLLYYTAPLLVFIVSPFLLGDSLTWYKIFGIIAAVIGLLIINGVGIGGENPKLGLICGLVAALLYAILMLANKFIKGLSAVEATWAQLMISAIFTMIYVWSGDFGAWGAKWGESLGLLILIGVLHTGLACWLYFGALQRLSGPDIALLSYIEPAATLFLAAFIFEEPFSGEQVVGALLMLGGTAFAQLYNPHKTAET